MELDRQANALWAFASRLPPGQTRAEGCPDDCHCSAACTLFTRRAEAKDLYKEQYLDLEIDLQLMDEDYVQGAAIEQLVTMAEAREISTAAYQPVTAPQLAADEELAADVELTAAEAASEAAAEANSIVAKAGIYQGEIALLAAGKRKADTPFSAFLADVAMLDDDLQIALGVERQQPEEPVTNAEAAREAAAEANSIAADAAISRGELDALLAAGKRKADTSFSAFLEGLGLDDDVQIALRANFEREAKQQEERDAAADLRTLQQIPARGSDADNDAHLEEFIRDKDTLYAKIKDRKFLTDDERARARRYLRLEARLAEQDMAADAAKLATAERNKEYRTIIDISKSPTKTASKYLCKYACKPAADEPKRRCSRQDARFENLPDFTLDCGVCGYNGIQNQIQADAHYAGHLNDFYNK
ncbi:hypothetical protein T492DRAFT_894617 [Pavlovales sp. CCMP2436]|nr:hypothetical protein T492DRAFT_894617 [Pavlovales sp. CCMP2436]